MQSGLAYNDSCKVSTTNVADIGTWQVRQIVTSTDSTASGGTKISSVMTVTLTHFCKTVTPHPPPDLEYTMSNANTNSDNVLKPPTTTNDSACNANKAVVIERWKDSAWIAYGAGDWPAWASCCTGNKFTIQKNTSSEADVIAIATVKLYTFRVTWNYGTKGDSNDKPQHTFTLTMLDECEKDFVTATAIGDKVYQIASAVSPKIQPTFTQNISPGCPADTRTKLKIRKTEDATWAAFGTYSWIAESPTNVYTVTHTDKTIVGEYYGQDTYSSKRAKGPNGQATVSFKMTIKDRCSVVKDQTI